jgi:hypothetical protein
MALRLGRRRIAPPTARRIASCARPTTWRTGAFATATALASTPTGTATTFPGATATAPLATATTTAITATATFSHERSFRCRSAGQENSPSRRRRDNKQRNEMKSPPLTPPESLPLHAISNKLPLFVLGHFVQADLVFTLGKSTARTFRGDTFFTPRLLRAGATSNESGRRDSENNN